MNLLTRKLLTALALVLPSIAEAQPAPQPNSGAAVNPLREPTSEANVASEQVEQELPSTEFLLPDGLSLDQLKQQLTALDEAGLSDGDRSQAAENYQKAIEWETTAQQHMAQAAEFEQQRLALGPSAPVDDPATPSTESETAAQRKRRLGEIAYYRARLEADVTTRDRENLASLPQEELASQTATAEKAVNTYRTSQEKWLAEPARRQTRLAQITDEFAVANNDVAQTTEQLVQLQTNGTGGAAKLSARARLEARRRAWQAKVFSLDREQAYLRESAPLVKLRLDDASQRLPEQEKWLADLRAEENRRSELDAADRERQAKREAAIVRPQAIAELADRNAQLAELSSQVVQKLKEMTNELTEANDRKEKLQGEFALTKQKLGVGELSNALGELLRNQEDRLPDLRAIKRSRALRSAERSEIQRALYEMTSRSAQLAAIDEVAAETMQQLSNPSEVDEKKIQDLLKSERSLLDVLIKDYDRYATDLEEIDAVQSQIQTITEDYRNFIAQRVLWIRSAELLHVRDMGPGADAVAWSLDPRNWTDAGLATINGCRRRPITASLITISLTALLYFQRRARRRLRELGEQACKRTCDEILPTLRSVWLTVVVSLPWPVLVVCLGRMMDSPLNESEFVRSLSISLQFTAVWLLLLELVRQLCRRLGLADAHFGWPESCLIQVRSSVRRLIIIAAPLVLWIAGLEVQRQETSWTTTLGRVCFIALMFGCTLMLHGLFMRENSPIRRLMLDQSRGWLSSFSKLWRPVVAYLPAGLAVLAATGYYYTAQQAALRVLETTALMLGVLVLGGLTRRWLLVNRRRLARAQAMQRRAQLAAASESDPAAAPMEITDELVDLAALSEQSEKLVRTVLAIIAATGLYFVWHEILPALAFIDSPIPGLASNEISLTWGRLLSVTLILTMTYLSVRDIPALLEVVVLQKLPLDGGSRYALSTICRYILTGIGLTVAYQMLGFTGNIQWLIAAMGVGLGFGLQEIFANFVSGIILLFERPIRVGDIVTLGDKTGSVSRIRMRATTIVDWDRKEYIVPNKDLMTERLLNWTLTDLINRIVIEVGVAYGTDTDRATALLLEAAKEHPLILDDPSPIATFEGFGDSSLNLTLRCYLPNLENRLPTIHALHGAIDRKFREAGIEIPFPQRDLHLRSSSELSNLFPPGRHTNGKAANGELAHATIGDSESHNGP